jgi:hypothetical protein
MASYESVIGTLEAEPTAATDRMTLTAHRQHR